MQPWNIPRLGGAGIWEEFSWVVLTWGLRRHLGLRSSEGWIAAGGSTSKVPHARAWQAGLAVGPTPQLLSTSLPEHPHVRPLASLQAKVERTMLFMT